MSEIPPPATTTPEDEIYAIVELMGRIKYGGKVTLNSGVGDMIRIDVPRKDGTTVTQLISPSSLFRITFTDKALATAAALAGDPMPYSTWELRDLVNGPIIDPQPQLNYGGYNLPDDDDDGE